MASMSEMLNIVANDKLPVTVPAELADALPEDKMDALKEILAQDPRPHYQDDPERIYGFPFADKEIKFKVNEKGLSVVSIA